MDITLGPEVMGEQKEAEVISWSATDGARVEKGQLLATVETGKASLEVAAPAAGNLQILAGKGAVVEAGAVIGRIL